MTGRALTVRKQDREPGKAMGETVLNFLGRVPHTEEHRANAPVDRAQTIANGAARRAATTAGSLALPPGPFGWLTVLPELVTVWKIQAQMVADIAGAYGKTAFLSREQMIYCLFRHSAAQAVRDLVVRVGERYLVQRISLRALQVVARAVGVRVTQQALGKTMSRVFPLVGAMGVGAYAYFDTRQVARTAIALFEHDIEVVAEHAAEETPV
jgi:uncharacterized protein (DUF697 family)